MDATVILREIDLPYLVYPGRYYEIELANGLKMDFKLREGKFILRIVEGKLAFVRDA